MTVQDKITIREDFSNTPGARYEADGPFSGELFLNSLLEPKFLDAIKNNYKLLIDLDGVWGYPSSFVSGSFGKLSIKYGKSLVLKHLDFKSEQSSIRKDKIIYEINYPKK